MASPLLQDEIEQLLKIKTESKNLDYKEGINWATCDRDVKIRLVKDVLAMANTRDGGRIIIGVRDGDLELIGLSEDGFTSFDQTRLNDFIQKYTDPKFSCQVYKVVVRDKWLIVIDVPEFPEVPILCKVDANSSKDGKLLLRRGQMYIRTEKGTSEAVSSEQEMREVLGRALIKMGDTLLASIERLIKGKPAAVAEEARDQYREEIEEAEGFIEKTIGEELKQYGSWNVCAYPSEYAPNRIADHKTIRDLMNRSEVELRGWNFPHTDEQNAAKFLKGRQSHTIWERYVEAYRTYQSGLFIWSRVFWEDKKGEATDGKPVLSFVSAIWSITEFLLFIKRYYEEVNPDGALHLAITLNRTEGRQLASLQSNAHLSRGYVSSEESIILEEDVSVVTLRASFKEIANALTRRMFAVFNWDDASEAVIDGWQTKLLERKF